MTWIGLVVRNLLRRPVRTSLTAAGVALGVGLIVALLSVTEGATKTADQLIHFGRADFGLFQAGASDLTLSRLPESLESQVARVPGVAATGRIYLYVKNDTSSRVIISTGWIISLLALIVGGIAVTNTMAMSVFERFREIGILRAVGWRTSRIAALIVCEALGICLLALAVGLALGYAAAYVFSEHD